MVELPRSSAVAAGVVGHDNADARPLLPPRGSGSDGAFPEAAVFLDLEEGGATPLRRAGPVQDERRSMRGLIDGSEALRRAMQRPDVALLVAVLVLCMAVSVGCWAMHVAGWVMLISSLTCSHQAELRAWLLLYLAGALAELCLMFLARVCHHKMVQDLGVRVGPSFIRVCNVCYTLLASALKIFWCVRAQVLVAAARSDGGCGASMPRFVAAFSVVVLVRLLAVDTFLGLMAGLVLRFVEASAARAGDVPEEDAQAGGPAKPGTLEAMRQVEYSDSLFGDEEGIRLSRECCFCLEEFDHKETIVITPCRHTMHRGCLEKWLQKSHLCPICRGDLEEA